MAASDTLRGSIDGPESVQVEASDIIRLVAQFLKEQGLSHSLEVLQSESGVGLNTVDAIEPFAAAVRGVGRSVRPFLFGALSAHLQQGARSSPT